MTGVQTCALPISSSWSSKVRPGELPFLQEPMSPQSFPPGPGNRPASILSFSSYIPPAPSGTGYVKEPHKSKFVWGQAMARPQVGRTIGHCSKGFPASCPDSGAAVGITSTYIDPMNPADWIVLLFGRTCPPLAPIGTPSPAAWGYESLATLEEGRSANFGDGQSKLDI